jgi:hypothetical protein
MLKVFQFVLLTFHFKSNSSLNDVLLSFVLILLLYEEKHHPHLRFADSSAVCSFKHECTANSRQHPYAPDVAIG